ncbi:DUF1542 domain-containing protein [Nocardia caishijiensis]|uniref:DUF1542 domain-containing protein n=1 Tax=Nocardia caishijiensis TaxID=184756 RepID=A0ABQ6YQS5_9NOCA|nr:DUF1542 domain-containing protein [Nocardia caishijiensis]KAF0848144.1 hypothetical protein FNL39_102292 [Nocardia caishijiensis]
MLWWLILILVLSVGALLYLRAEQNKRTAREFDEARAEARLAIERLGGQLHALTPANRPADHALADATDRYNAANTQLDRASTPHQATLANRTALEGLHYTRAARQAMKMDPGPELPALDGQDIAGRVEQPRTIDYNGRPIAASPEPSAATRHYFPGGRVAGRPVPAGWYSEPWWKPALLAGAWGTGSTLLFAALFTGMPGIGYDAEAFENGTGRTETPTDLPDPGYDTGTYPAF